MAFFHLKWLMFSGLSLKMNAVYGSNEDDQPELPADAHLPLGINWADFMDQFDLPEKSIRYQEKSAEVGSSEDSTNPMQPRRTPNTSSETETSDKSNETETLNTSETLDKSDDSAAISVEPTFATEQQGTGNAITAKEIPGKSIETETLNKSDDPVAISVKPTITTEQQGTGTPKQGTASVRALQHESSMKLNTAREEALRNLTPKDRKMIEDMSSTELQKFRYRCHNLEDVLHRLRKRGSNTFWETHRRRRHEWNELKHKAMRFLQTKEDRIKLSDMSLHEIFELQK